MSAIGFALPLCFVAKIRCAHVSVPLYMAWYRCILKSMGAKVADNTIYLMNRAMRLLTRRADERLRALGFTAAQMPVLRALKDGRPLTQKDLAGAAQVEQPAMAEVLSRMQRDGLIERLPNPKDGRSKLYQLTVAGKQAIPSARAALAQGHSEAFVNFTSEEIRLVGALVNRMTSNLEADVMHE